MAILLLPVPASAQLDPDCSRFRTHGLRRLQVTDRELPAAVALGQRWLQRQQAGSGLWPARSRDDSESRRLPSPATIESTAVALLVFLSDRDPATRPVLPATIRRGLDALRRSQHTNGSFAANRPGSLRAHAVAALAMVEGAACSRKKGDLDSAVRALAWLAKSECADGGWSVDPAGRTDPETTCWVIHAASSARAFGIACELDVQRVRRSLAALQDARAHRDRRAIATAAATWTAILTGGDQGSAEVPVPDLANPNTTRHPVELLLHASCARQRGGPVSDRWRKHVLPRIAAAIRRDGELAGSWDPEPGSAGRGGRVHTTALRVLTLQSRYRYGVAPQQQPATRDR